MKSLDSQGTEVEFRPQHLPRIDVLRAIAIFLVFANHFHSAVSGDPETKWVGNWFTWSDAPSLFEQFLRVTLYNGHGGVCLFFVISGLCIRLSQAQNARFSIPGFYWRRFWRIYPPYLVALVVCVLLARQRDFLDIVTHLLLIHNISIDYVMSINGPFWSLALEIQVYLLFPFLLILHQRLGVPATSCVLFILAALPAFLGSRGFLDHFHLSHAYEMIRFLPLSLWFTWYMGFLLADVLLAGKLPTFSWRLVSILSIAIFLLSNFYRPLLLVKPALAGIMLALLAWEYLSSASPFRTFEKLISYLGICSYSFYLYFDKLISPCLELVKSCFPQPLSITWLYAIGFPVTLLIIFVISYLLYLVIELSSLKLGRYLNRSKAIPKS